MLIEIGAGTVAVAHVIDLAGGIGRGFAGTTAAICAAVIGLALVILAALPPPAELISVLRGDDLATLVHSVVIFMVLLALDVLFAVVGTDIARRVIGVVTSALGVAAVVRGGLLLAPVMGGSADALLLVVPATLLSGTAWAGMLLGHWYLVTPSLSFKPLRQAVGMIFGAVGVEAVAIVIALVSVAPGARQSVVGGDSALLFWLLVVGSGVVFTAAVNGLTYFFARTRANQPATAMLYVLIISVLMGVVPAQLIALQTGVPV